MGLRRSEAFGHNGCVANQQRHQPHTCCQLPGGSKASWHPHVHGANPRRYCSIFCWVPACSCTFSACSCGQLQLNLHQHCGYRRIVAPPMLAKLWFEMHVLTCQRHNHSVYTLCVYDVSVVAFRHVVTLWQRLLVSLRLPFQLTAALARCGML